MEASRKIAFTAALRHLVPVSVVLLAGCSSNSPTGPGAEAQAFGHLNNLMPVSFTAGGAGGWAMVDTGNPVIELNPGTFPVAQDATADETIEVAGQTVSASAIGYPQPAIDAAFPLVGNLGCGVLCGHVASFDYRDVVFTLGNELPSAPLAVMPDVAVPFSLEGGRVAPAPSHVVVTVSIEGHPYTLQVDTGAAQVTVSQSVYAAITSDGRKQIPIQGSTAANGSGGGSATRVSSIAVGGAQASSIIVAHLDDFDITLQRASADIGRTLDGSLGTTFLNHFFVTVDYPHTTVHFAPYEDTSFVVDTAENLGFGFASTASGGGYPVAAVLPGSDAATKGVQIGDVVVSVDGQSLASLTSDEAQLLVFGAVGTTKMVQFGAAMTLGNRTVPIAMMELLPLHR